MSQILRSRPLPPSTNVRRSLLLREPQPVIKPLRRPAPVRVPPSIAPVVEPLAIAAPPRREARSGPSRAVPWVGLVDMTFSGNRIVDVRDIVAYPETPDTLVTGDGSPISALRFVDNNGDPVAMGVEGLPGPIGPPGPPGPPGEDGDVPEAPTDGQQYAREDGTWTVVEPAASDWADITGKPATFPPTIPTGPAIATWPYLPLTGGTLSGALIGTTATMSGTVVVGSNLLVQDGGYTYTPFNGSTNTGTVRAGVQYDGLNQQLGFYSAGTFRGLINSLGLFNWQGAIKAQTSTAIPAGGTLGAGYLFSSTANFGINFGSGAPDKAQAKGSIYLRSDGTGAPYYNADGTGAGWTQIGSGGGVTVAATAPATPTDGQLWYNSDASVGGGNLYIRYNDGTSTAWVPASTANAGSVVQTVSFQTGAVASGTGIIPFDDTIPQITEGDQYMTLAITPRSSTSKLIIDVAISLATNQAGQNALLAALFQDSAVNALASGWMSTSSVNFGGMLNFRHTMTSGTTSATTFRVRGGCTAGTTTFNGAAGARYLGGVAASSIVIQEVL